MPKAKFSTALVLIIIGAGAHAAPMDDARYSKAVIQEVDFQNLTCPQMLDLDRVFEELFTCPPTPPALFNSIDLNSIDPSTQAGGNAIASRLAMTTEEIDPPRLCGAGRLRPIYRLRPDLYEVLGQTGQAYLASAGVPPDMDVEHSDLRLGYRTPPQIFAPGVISSLQNRINTAMRLRNCRIP